MKLKLHSPFVPIALLLCVALPRYSMGAPGDYKSKFGNSKPGGPYVDGDLDDPRSIDSTAGGNLIIPDDNRDDVQIFNSSGGFLSKFGSTGIGDGQFGIPTALAVAPNGNILVLDNSRDDVQIFNSSGGFLSKFGANGDGNGQFQSADGIAVGPNNNIITVDDSSTAGPNFQIFSSSGAFISKVVTPPPPPAPPGGFSLAGRTINYEIGFSSDPQTGGNLPISGSFVVGAGVEVNAVPISYQFLSSGFTQTLSGTFTIDVNAPNSVSIQFIGTAQGGGLTCKLTGLNWNNVGEVIGISSVTNSGHISGVSQPITPTFGATSATFGFQPFGFQPGTNLTQSGVLDVSSAPIFRLNRPQGCAVAPNGDIYISDAQFGEEKILVFDSAGAFKSQIGSSGSGTGQLLDPRGIVVAPNGDILVVENDNDRVQVFNSSGTSILTFGTLGSFPYADGSFDDPRDLCLLPNGDVAVIDENRDDVQIFQGKPEWAVAAADVGILSLNRVGVSPTNSATVQWDVTFDGAVSGLGATNFALVDAGNSITGESIASVVNQGGGTVWRINANTGTGSGTLGLNLANDTGLTPTTSNELFTGQVYTIDKTPPAVPSTPDLISASDSGSSATDNNTKDNTPTLTGTGENGSTVTLTSSITGNVGTFVVAGGNWTITTPVLADGTHTFTARAADALGNTSAPSSGLSVVIDTVISPPTGLDMIAASDSGASTTDDITMVTTPKITGDAETGSLVALTSSLNGAVGSGTANSPFMITTSMLSNGVHQITATATDLAGNASGPSAPLQIAVDTVIPVVASAKDLVVNFPTGAAPAPVSYPAPSATDNFFPPSPPVACVPPSGSNFPLGVTTVTCTATDTAGNMASVSFAVIALEEQASPGERFLDKVSLRGDAATGPGVPAGATIFNIYRAHLSNSGTVVFDAALSGAGTKNTGVFSGPVAGPHPALAVKGTAAPGGGLFGAFSSLSINATGSTSFQSAIGSNPSLFSGGMVAAARGGLAPTGGGETYIVLQKPALASEGSLLVTGNLQLGSGLGVTVGEDTLLVRGATEVLAREGGASSLAATAYGHFHPRVVASDRNDRYAFSAFLLETPFDPSDNTALFTGVLGGGAPQAVVREGEVAAGTGGATFSIFMGEAVNSAGEIVLRANVAGTGVAAANNEGLWTTSGNIGGSPLLVAREGDVAPCLPDNLAAFERFSFFHLGDDGSVCFFAYLKDATATPAVHSGNDGSLWRWSNGQLHLIAREGGTANNTAGAIIGSFGTISCNGTGGIAFEVSLVSGFGDTTSSTNQAVFLDRGMTDPVPLLVLRRGDTFDLGGGDMRTVVGLSTTSETNVGGATGGYGRSINDAGEILLNLTLSGNASGVFVLGMPAAPPPP
jgi:hypothetical protein